MINHFIYEVYNEKTGKQVDGGFNGCYNIGLDLKEVVSCVKSLNDHEHRNGRVSIYAIRRLTSRNKVL